MNAEDPSAAPPAPIARNLVELLLQRARTPSGAAALWKTEGGWQEVSWEGILQRVRALSAGLLAQGVRPGERVALFADSSLQWVVCDLAIAAAQAITVPLDASSTPEECRRVLGHSEAALVFVDHDTPSRGAPGRVSRIRWMLGECPSVRTLVRFEGAAAEGRERTLDDVMAQGRADDRAHPHAFEARAHAIQADDASCILYTSGTAEEPRGVLLTHGNWVYAASGVREIGLMEPTASVMLALPLAHSFAQVIKASWLSTGFRLVFAESADKLLASLKETRPTLLPAAPRTLEKLYGDVVSAGSSAPGVRGRLFRWAFQLFEEYVEARTQGREYNSLQFLLARKLVFQEVRAALDEMLGGNLRLFVSSGAPLPWEVAYFFDLLGYKVLESYGLTETSAATTLVRPERIRIGTVGPPLPGTEVKLALDGELLIRGPGVMKGYFRDEAATAAAIDPQGWFHSGDVGEVDADECVRITARNRLKPVPCRSVSRPVLDGPCEADTSGLRASGEPPGPT